MSNFICSGGSRIWLWGITKIFVEQKSKMWNKIQITYTF